MDYHLQQKQQIDDIKKKRNNVHNQCQSDSQLPITIIFMSLCRKLILQTKCNIFYAFGLTSTVIIDIIRLDQKMVFLTDSNLL